MCTAKLLTHRTNLKEAVSWRQQLADRICEIRLPALLQICVVHTALLVCPEVGLDVVDSQGSVDVARSGLFDLRGQIGGEKYVH